MKNALLLLVLVLFGFSVEARELGIILNPKNPILIPISSTTKGPVAPYFSMDSITFTWAGSKAFQVLSTDFYYAATSQHFNCGARGVELATLFAQSVYTDRPVGCSGVAGNPAMDSSGILTFPAIAISGCKVSVKSESFFCDQLPIKVSANPFASYHIPLSFIVLGAVRDQSGTVVTKRYTSKTLTIQ